MKAPALLAIRLYQRFISPYKGFSCAYRVHTGLPGCSGLADHALRPGRDGMAHGAGG